MIKMFLKPVLLVSLIAGLLTGCFSSEKAEIQSIYGYSMGTSYNIKLVGTLNDARNLQLGIEGVLSDINARMSTYLPRSDLSIFSQAAVNEFVSVDEKTLQVVESALRIAEKTQGAFDPTVAPLVNLWGFGPKARNNSVPSKQEITRILQEVGYEAILFESTTNMLSKTDIRSLDLSGIAKGYAVDQVAEYLLAKDFDRFLIEVGGEMRFSGLKPNGSPWRIAIEKPSETERSVFKSLDVEAGAIATSGDYRNYFEIDGNRYSHTIDPKTGYPIEHDIASVTVVMDSCMEADAYATAFSVLGKQASLKLAEEYGIAVYIIFRNTDGFESIQSTAFSARFGELES